MTRLFIPSQASHWYSKDGIPVHQVPNKSKPGQMRQTTLRDGKSLGLLPSVTSVVKAVLAKPQLESWKQEQAVLAALTLPRLPDENDTDFAKRVVMDAESIAENAANKGTKIHNAIERYLMTGEKCLDLDVAHLVEPFYDWANENITNVIKCEETIVSQDGYAGRLDLLAEFQGIGLAVADFKTRKKTDGKLASYAEDCIQLAAYSQALEVYDYAHLSLLINSEEPESPFIKQWSREDVNDHRDVFNHLFSVWCILKKYRPKIK